MTDLIVRGHTTELRPLNGRKLLRCTRCERTGTLASFMDDGCHGLVVADQDDTQKEGAPTVVEAPTTITRPRCTTNEDRTSEQ